MEPRRWVTVVAELDQLDAALRDLVAEALAAGRPQLRRLGSWAALEGLDPVAVSKVAFARAARSLRGVPAPGDPGELGLLACAAAAGDRTASGRLDVASRGDPVALRRASTAVLVAAVAHRARTRREPLSATLAWVFAPVPGRSG